MTKNQTPIPLLLADVRSRAGFPWLVGYALVSTLHVLAEGMNWSELMLYTKPTLMWWLLLFVWQQTSHRQCSAKWLLMAALLASNAGDIFLLFAGKGENFFILGLGSFLIAHLAYIFTFSRLSDSGFERPSWYLLIFLLLYWISFNAVMWDGMPASLKPPVVLYSLVILVMVAFARSLFRQSAAPGRQWLWWGALLFLLSDSLYWFE